MPITSFSTEELQLILGVLEYHVTQHQLTRENLTDADMVFDDTAAEIIAVIRSALG